jgi:hypothetical protein
MRWISRPEQAQRSSGDAAGNCAALVPAYTFRPTPIAVDFRLNEPCITAYYDSPTAVIMTLLLLIPLATLPITSGEMLMVRRTRLVLALLACALPVFAAETDSSGWTTIFDGKSFNGWKANEHKESWKIEDGAFVCRGERSHLFYIGDEKPFVNFEFQCESMTTPGSNAGIYFHTKYQDEGWPKYGYECQVNISHKDPIKSGSLYGTVNVSNPPAKDNEWYTTNIRVEGRHVVVKVNDKVVVDYTEPENKEPFNGQFERRLGSGTFAFQAHDPKSVVSFRNVKVKRLP